MKKRIVATMIAMVAAVSLMGCGITTTSTYTETTTDADGNTVTTTTTTTNGETTTETTESSSDEEVVKNVATVAFDNETDFDIAELYFSSNSSDDWGDNILANEEPVAVGETITFNEAFTYSSDNTVWDMKIVDPEGNNVEFNGADMKEATDPENIHITFIVEEAAQSYSATIE